MLDTANIQAVHGLCMASGDALLIVILLLVIELLGPLVPLVSQWDGWGFRELWVRNWSKKARAGRTVRTF